ncbi:MAG: glycosyltransferase family 2 protein [Minicystis sp.]
MIALDVLASVILAAPVLACAAYLFVLALAAWPARRGGRARDLRFDIVVPAHDEEIGIAATIESLRALDYPAGYFRILVVADNCTDGTAEVARAAGVIVLERHDPERRGKGYALAHAFAAVERDGIADAIVVIDADTEVSPNLLRAFADRIATGASAVQARYGVRNAEASWRTRLMVVALALFNDLRSLGRDRLGLSTGLRGNGMAFTRDLIRRVPPAAFSIVEDLEYGIALGEAGHRVHYAHEAQVLGDMAAGPRAAATQRRRWEQGRAALARALGPRLLMRGIARRDPVVTDLAIDLLVPPLSAITIAATAGFMAALTWHLAAGGSGAILYPWLGAMALLAVYVLRGVQISDAGYHGLLALLWAPVYVIWKLGLRLRRRDRDGQWIRTAREVER